MRSGQGCRQSDAVSAVNTADLLPPAEIARRPPESSAGKGFECWTVLGLVSYWSPGRSAPPSPKELRLNMLACSLVSLCLSSVRTGWSVTNSRSLRLNIRNSSWRWRGALVQGEGGWILVVVRKNLNSYKPPTLLVDCPVAMETLFTTASAALVVSSTGNRVIGPGISRRACPGRPPGPP